MELDDIVEVLRAKSDKNRTQQADPQIQEMRSEEGFGPKLLEILRQQNYTAEERLCAAECLNDLIKDSWNIPENQKNITYVKITEQDRDILRNNILEATVEANETIRPQLHTTIYHIIRYDFPHRWADFADKIHMFLQDPDQSKRIGGIECVYVLIDVYAYSTEDERKPLNEAMVTLLSDLYNILINLRNNEFVWSIIIKKHIVKCYYKLIKYSFSLELHSKEVFSNWMRELSTILLQRLPGNEYEIFHHNFRKFLPGWALKKWAILAIVTIFDRYVDSTHLRMEYREFADWYMVTFTRGIIEVLLKILDNHKNQKYVSPCVLSQTFYYLSICVQTSSTWNLISEHMEDIIENNIYPLLSFVGDSQNSWMATPAFYFRTQNAHRYKDFLAPMETAKLLLCRACAHNENVLDSTVSMCIRTLITPRADPRFKDGAFHIIGTLHNVFRIILPYNLGIFLKQLVFPEFENPIGHRRARAAWVLQCYSRVVYDNDDILLMAMELIVNALLHDTELSVKMEASIAIPKFICTQMRAYNFFEPKVKEITTKLLEVLHETETQSIEDFKDVISVLLRLVPEYAVQLQPIAHEIINNVTVILKRVIDRKTNWDDTSTVAPGQDLLRALKMTLSTFGNSPEIMAQVDQMAICGSISNILRKNRSEYFKEALAFLRQWSASNISEAMWNILPVLYEIYPTSNYGYFNDIAPILYNYITVETNAFLSNKYNYLTVCIMLKKVLETDIDLIGLYAAKLLEIMVLECSGKINDSLPLIVDLVETRMGKEFKRRELTLMLKQVLIAIFYTDPKLMFKILKKRNPGPSTIEDFVTRWISYSYCFDGIHDKKLSVLALFKLLDMRSGKKSIGSATTLIIPCIIFLLEELSPPKWMELECDHDTQEQANSSSSSSVYWENPYPIPLDMHGNPCYEAEEFVYNLLTKRYNTAVEKCGVDEFILFYHLVQDLAEKKPNRFERLRSQLTKKQKKKAFAIMQIAKKRVAAAAAREQRQSEQ